MSKLGCHKELPCNSRLYRKLSALGDSRGHFFKKKEKSVLSSTARDVERNSIWYWNADYILCNLEAQSAAVARILVVH